MTEPQPTDSSEPTSSGSTGERSTDESRLHDEHRGGEEVSGGLGDADMGDNVRELADVPSVEVISRAAVMLMSSAAEKLGLSEDEPDSAATRDLDEARRIITALAGLVSSSVEYLGPHAGALRDGLQTLQRAFREASAEPDAPGQGPGEKYTGPVY